MPSGDWSQVRGNMGKYYKGFDVWKRGREKLQVFRCFEIIPNGGYCVQSSDFYRKDQAGRVTKDHEKQFLELLMDEPPELRSRVFPTIEEAILDFETTFEN